jgi:hypothetical protein
VTTKAEELLGKSVTDILHSAPFCDWPFEKNADNDLDEPLVYFEFKDHGVSLTCRDTDTISTVHFSASGQAASYFGLPTSLTRDKVRGQFGTPHASGEGVDHPILGNYGPYDRYDHSDHSVHFEFFPDVDKIRLITVMTRSVVPGR